MQALARTCNLLGPRRVVPLVLALATLLAPPLAAQPTEGADLLLRYPAQVTFTVWGDGATYNAILLEAEPGDALNATLLVRPRGRDNTLTAPVAYNVTMSLVRAENTTLLDAHNGTLAPGETADQRIELNGTLPDLPPGAYRIRFHLETGDWDPDPDNNDPAPVPLRIGTLERAALPFQFHPRYLLGPILFAAVLALPVAHRVLHRRPGWRRLADQSHMWWDRRSAAWYQSPRAQRMRLGGAVLAGAVLVGFLLSLLAVGGLARGAATLGDAAIVGLFAAAVHLIVAPLARLRRARLRRQEGTGTDLTFPQAVHDSLVPVVRTFALVALAALVWQQLAALTSFFRWPRLSTLDAFAIIGVRHGAVYALIALGYTMVYGILKFINFAHGEVFTWGAYFTWFFATGAILRGIGGEAALLIGFPLAILIGVLLTGLLSATMERVAYRPLRGATRLAPLVTAIALSVLLQALAQFFFGAEAVSFTAPGVYRGSTYQDFLNRSITILDQRVPYLALVVLATSIILMLALHLFIQRSRTGRAMRAVSDDLDTARTIGIRVDRIITITFLISGILAAVGGLFYALEHRITPTMGLIVGIKAFAAAVVGGIGNIHGAFLAGFIIGMAENVGSQFIDGRFQSVITFAILIGFLLLRPRGILTSSEGVERR